MNFSKGSWTPKRVATWILVTIGVITVYTFANTAVQYYLSSGNQAFQVEGEDLAAQAGGGSGGGRPPAGPPAPSAPQPGPSGDSRYRLPGAGSAPGGNGNSFRDFIDSLPIGWNNGPVIKGRVTF